MTPAAWSGDGLVVIRRPSGQRALYGGLANLVTVAVSDAHGASATAFLSLEVAASE